MARIFRRDQVGAGEHGESAKRNVGEVADRRRHEIEAGGKLPLHFAGERGFNALNQPARCVLVVVAMILHACAYSSGRLPVNCLKCGLERRYARRGAML